MADADAKSERGGEREISSGVFHEPIMEEHRAGYVNFLSRENINEAYSILRGVEWQ